MFFGHVDQGIVTYFIFSVFKVTIGIAVGKAISIVPIEAPAIDASAIDTLYDNNCGGCRMSKGSSWTFDRGDGLCIASIAGWGENSS